MPVKKLRELLDSHRVQYVSIVVSRAYTAQEIAAFAHVPGRELAKAVVQTCAANALAVAIPCHRVVRNDGGLSRYRWGVERKRALLEKEAHA